MENKKDFIQIEEGGSMYETSLTKKYSSRKVWEGHRDSREIYSSIPGIITSISVSEGDYVEYMQDLLHFEAMKMESIIRAPFKGIVDKIYITKGDKVPKDTIMVRLIKIDS